MNTKGTKFLAVLAVLAMAFAVFAVTAPSDDADAATAPVIAIDKVGYYQGEEVGSNEIFLNQVELEAGNATETTAVYEISGLLNYITDSPTSDLKTLWESNTTISATNAGGVWFSLSDYSAYKTMKVTTELGGAWNDGDAYVLDDVKETHGGETYIPFAIWMLQDTMVSNEVTIELFKQDSVAADYTITIVLGLEAAALCENDDALRLINNLYDNAATEVKDSDGNGWSYDVVYDNEKIVSGVLVLNNYNGSNVFSGIIDQVTVTGTNTISAEGVSYAIASTEDLVIKPVSGLGTLKIVLDEVPVPELAEVIQYGPAAAIIADSVSIQSVNIDIDLLSDDESDGYICGIFCTGSFTLYNATLAIDITADATTGGIYASSVDVKSAPSVTIDAQLGIFTGSMDVAESTIALNTEYYGLWANDVKIVKNTTITATKTSDYDGFESLGFTKTLNYDGFEPLYAIMADSLQVESESIILADSLALLDGTSANYATVSVKGDMIVKSDAELYNFSAVNVSGDLMVIGAVNNQGTFDVTGNVILSKIDDIVYTEGAPVFTFIEPELEGDDEIYVSSIQVISTEISTKGNAYIWATVTFSNKETEVGSKTVAGTATLDKDGRVTAMSFTLLTSTGEGDAYVEAEADLSVTYTAPVTTQGATRVYGQYAVSASGSVYLGDVFGDVVDSTTYDEATAETEIKNPIAIADEANGLLTAVSGTFTAKTIYVYSDNIAFVNGGTITAPVIADAVVWIFIGELNGDITASADVYIDALGRYSGDITTTADVTVGPLGVMTGDITAKQNSDKTAQTASVTIDGIMTGDILVKDIAVSVSVKGTMTGDIVLSGSYKASTATDAASVDYSATLAIAIIGDGDNASVIKTVPSAVATAGYFLVDGTLAAPEEDYESLIIIESGLLNLKETFNVEVGFSVEAASGATITVVKGASVNVAGAVVIDDGATLNMYDKEAKITGYGKLLYEISYYDAGKTYYCSFTFALSNAPADSTLNIPKQANSITVTTDASVKDGVTVNIAAGQEVVFQKALTMGTGASIVLGDGSIITFATTPENKTVSGTFDYGDNEVILEKVVFTQQSSMTAMKATTKAPAELDVLFYYNAGKVIANKGLIGGTLTLVTKESGTTTKTYSSGTFDIEAVYVGAIVEDDQKRGAIVINGEYAPTGSIEINNAYSGTGYITLGDDKTVTINNYVISKKTVLQNLTVSYGLNAVTLKDLALNAAVAATADSEAVAAGVMTITSKKATSSEDAKLIVAATTITSGTVTLDGVVDFQKVDLDTKGTIIAEDGSKLTLVSGTTTTATGLLKVHKDAEFKFSLNGDSTKTYGILNNQVQYVDGDYTVYTMLVTAVTEGKQTAVTTTDDINIDKDADLGDVTITIADGKVLYIGATVSIGTAVTSISGDASIVGKVVLNADKAMLIAYSNANVTNVVQKDKTTAAVTSDVVIDLNGQLYATVYAQTDMVEIDEAEAAMSPSITGYRFAGWSTEVYFAENDEPMVGETAILLLLSAKTVTVTLTTVDGAIYYVNNTAVAQTGAPITLKVGDIVSAAPDRSNGYSGTVKVNSEAYITISESTKTVTASGVVAPSADSAKHVIVDNDVKTVDETVKENGFGITEILLVVLVILIAIMVVVVILRLNRS